MVKVSAKKTNSKSISYIIIAILLFVFIFKLDIFGIMDNNSSSGSTDVEINIKDESESLTALQGKWCVTLNGYTGDENIQLRLLINGNTVELYSKKESQNNWNMDSPDEVSRLDVAPYMADYAYTEIYHRMVNFDDVREKNDVSGKISMTRKMGSMKLYKDRVEMFSMIGLSGFSRGWD